MAAAIAVSFLTPAAGLCGEDVECQVDTAARFAPIYRLDYTSVTEKRCLPGHPATVYEQRKAGNDRDICEDDITKLENVPIFYHYGVRLLDSPPRWAECESGAVVIDYWIWYSHQPACLKINTIQNGQRATNEYGAHRADWEKVVVHIMDEVKKVRYHQHSGSYTKHRDNVEFVDSHPVAYVGQDSHGSYHNEGGTGNCLYFQDFRRFEDPQLKVDGWKNLISIKNHTEMPEWFTSPGEYLDGFPNPAKLKKRSGCKKSSCSGLDSWNAATGICTGVSCGCRKSDYCEDIKFGDITDKKPCEDTTLNEISTGGKNLINKLLDRGAQVSGTSALRSLWALWAIVLSVLSML